MTLASFEMTTDHAMTFAELPVDTCGTADCRHARGACDDCKVRLFSVCAALEPDELDELDRLSQVKHYPAKTMLFDQGAQAGAVFNVTEGVVPDSGHWIMEENPTATVKLVRGFLDAKS